MGNVSVMSPRIVLGAAPDADGPPLPSEVAGHPVWSERLECSIGTCQAWEYRHREHGRCLVIQRIADAGSGRALYAAWVPSDARDGANPVFALIAPLLAVSGVLVAHWECIARDGILAPAFDASPEAAQALAAWPATWREWLPNDTEAPTGAPIIGEVLA